MKNVKFASISDQLINTVIIMDMMFNTEMIVKDMKGGKEDMTEKQLDFSKWSLKKNKYGDLTVESARDVLDELVKLGYGDFELLLGYDGNLVYTGFTDNVFVIEKDEKILVKE